MKPCCEAVSLKCYSSVLFLTTGFELFCCCWIIHGFCLSWTSRLYMCSYTLWPVFMEKDTTVRIAPLSPVKQPQLNSRQLPGLIQLYDPSAPRLQWYWCSQEPSKHKAHSTASYRCIMVGWTIYHINKNIALFKEIVHWNNELKYEAPQVPESVLFLLCAPKIIYY